MKKDGFSKEEQIKLWSQLYGRQVSEEEYEKLCRNFGGFFGLLEEWDKRKAEKKKKGRPFKKRLLDT